MPLYFAASRPGFAYRVAEPENVFRRDSRRAFAGKTGLAACLCRESRKYLRAPCVRGFRVVSVLEICLEHYWTARGFGNRAAEPGNRTTAIRAKWVLAHAKPSESGILPHMSGYFHAITRRLPIEIRRYPAEMAFWERIAAGCRPHIQADVRICRPLSCPRAADTGAVELV